MLLSPTVPSLGIWHVPSCTEEQHKDNPCPRISSPGYPVCVNVHAGASPCTSQNHLCLPSHPCNPLCEVRTRCCSVPQVLQGVLCPPTVWPKHGPGAAPCTAGGASTPAWPQSSPLMRTSAPQKAIQATWEGWL